MNSLTEAIPMEVTTIRRSSLKDRSFTACYLTNRCRDARLAVAFG